MFQKDEPVKVTLKPGSKRQLSTVLQQNKSLVMNVTSSNETATLTVYVKVGNKLVNSASYDVKITLENVSE